MSILSGFLKTKRRRLTDEGYILQSEWTSASSVEHSDGKTTEEKVKDIEGIEITQAEYDALSDEEKITGVYWITDGAGGTGGTTNALTSADVVDNLESTATNLPLSANQGKILADKLGGFSLVKISQTEYDALTTKDENTIYFTYDE